MNTIINAKILILLFLCCCSVLNSFIVNNGKISVLRNSLSLYKYHKQIIPLNSAQVSLSNTDSVIHQPLRSLKNFFKHFASFIVLLKKLLFSNESKRSDNELKSGIANFYDESSAIWLDVWGEHMHHGYYPTLSYKNHQAAQIDMIDRSINWAYGDDLKNSECIPKNMIDVGCGVGGSSRHIARKFGCKGVGISLSPYQISRAKNFTVEQNLDHLLEYKVSDAMNMLYPAKTFDLTWSMESGEHMPNKQQFMNELYRVTTPGGRIIVVTWCHRELKDNEKSLKKSELRLLDKINDAYYLPDWCAASTYVNIANKLGLEDVRQDDWSEYIRPFWSAVFISALKPNNFKRLLRSGVTTIKGAIATLWMLRGFQKGTLKFVLITGRKKKY